jgi:hypothetical protein
MLVKKFGGFVSLFVVELGFRWCVCDFWSWKVKVVGRKEGRKEGWMDGWKSQM